jgi:mevalonate kinase
MSSDRGFYGKLLLFGEYTVVLGAQALVLPYEAVSGSWAFIDQMSDKAKAENSNLALKNYLQWLKQTPESKNVDIERFANELDAGLAFDSNIPNGYGVGSSGALVAALFDRYRRIDVPRALSDLRSILGKLENYFHGNSSGLDPLACFVGKPLLVKDKEIKVLDSCPVPDGLKFELHDTGITAPTGPLVAYFGEQMKHYSFYKKVDRQLIPATEKAIESWLNGNAQGVWEALGEISAIQLAHFQPMIPESIRPLWEENLQQGRKLMKLCGSGGGGYVLAFERG